MRVLLNVTTILCAMLLGCSSPSNPDAIRERTADATAAAKRDADAVAKGVIEGLRRKGPIDINKASKLDLMTLPGMTSEVADAIATGRPYTDASQLVRRHLVPRAEYDRIRSQIIVKPMNESTAK